MNKQIHDTSDHFIVDLLNNACTDPTPVENGYWTHRIETHCVAVTYTAKVISRDDNGTPTRYRIIHRDYESC